MNPLMSNPSCLRCAGFSINLKFQQNPLLTSPDCQQFQSLILDVTKSESIKEVAMSNRWSSGFVDFVHDLSCSPLHILEKVRLRKGSVDVTLIESSIRFFRLYLIIAMTWMI